MKFNNSMNIIIIVIIVIITICLTYNFLKVPIARMFVFYILHRLSKGNFMLIDKHDNEIIRIENDSKKYMPIIKILNEDNFFTKLFGLGEVGLGESYMNGDWISNDLSEFMNSMALNINNTIIPDVSIGKIFNTDLDYDKSNIVHHYDVGNDFYMTFLKDDLSAYTCGFWFNKTDTLNDAQYNKIHIIIKKMNPEENKRILDIGCGWGKIANYVANKTKCKVSGITISDEQVLYANQTFDKDNVQIKNLDYRLVNEKFDYIYSIGMFEHVRYENYDSFFQMIKRCLHKDGRFVLHTIIDFDECNKKAKKNGRFVTKHIFPGGQIPRNDWILDKVRNNGLNIIHFEGFGGQHYARTLKKWREYMIESKAYILEKYGIELFLKYEYYFAACEAGFNTGSMGIGHYIIVSDDILTTSKSTYHNIINTKLSL
jgi:cyclopropane-fatty-acyl-phospholipid synthase